MIRSRSLGAAPAGGGATVDLAPLIDVVFILLIFFLVTTTFARDRGIDVQRPTASAAAANPPDATRVQVSASGACFLEGQPIELSGLESRLREEIATGGVPAVVLVPDARVDAQRLVAVMDAAVSAGALDLAIATREEGTR